MTTTYWNKVNRCNFREISGELGIPTKGAFTLIRVRVLHRVHFLKSRSISSKVFTLGRARIRILHPCPRPLFQVHRLYMASASIRFFMKDEDAVTDADADQCKRTLTVNRVRLSAALTVICWHLRLGRRLGAFQIHTIQLRHSRLAPLTVTVSVSVAFRNV